jgi:chromosomal replication initiator protein
MIRVDRADFAHILPKEELAPMIAEVARVTGHAVEELTGRDRTDGIVKVRQHAMLLAHQAGYSMPQIGRAFNRDHTTVLEGIRHARRRMNGMQIDWIAAIPFKSRRTA